MKFIDKVILFVEDAHKGQFRWDNVTPFSDHPKEVRRLSLERISNNHLFIALVPAAYLDLFLLAVGTVALTHDIPEDVEEYKDQEEKLVAKLKELDTDKELFIDEGTEKVIVAALKALNKHYYENYLEFVLAAKNDGIARIVKEADISHNVQTTKKGSMKDKYLLAIHILNQNAI